MNKFKASFVDAICSILVTCGVLILLPAVGWMVDFDLSLCLVFSKFCLHFIYIEKEEYVGNSVVTSC